MTFGIDVSEHQGSIDWPKVAAAGVEFAIIRAGYGHRHVDRFFSRNWAAAKAAGVKRGGYLWFKASQDVDAQATLVAMGTTDAELAPWVDFEELDGLKPAHAWAQLALFVSALENLVGEPPVIYTGPSFWGSHWDHASDWARFPLAIAHYTKAKAPRVPQPWHSWAFWQHSSAGRVPGIPGPVDLDRASLVHLLTAEPAEAKEHPLVALNAPVVTIVETPTGLGYWQVAADGGVFAFGDADGRIANLETNPVPKTRLVAPIIDAAPTPSGAGLWLTAADGGVFALGDARFYGAANALS